MIFVVGTKRSGTSMWMQALVAAGFPAIGSAFPQAWGERLRHHNPRGFYESMFRMGVNYQTNPHPETGQFLPPADVERHLVKVFPMGLVRSDFGYISQVVATIRDWRSYDQSVRKLRTDDRPNRTQKMPPWLEWWLENYSLIRDLVIRRYPVVVTSYDAVLRDPEREIGRVVDWLGGADREAAIKSVDQELHRSQPSAEEQPDSTIVDVFDALYEAIDLHQTVPEALVVRMNETQARVLTEYREVIAATQPAAGESGQSAKK